MAEQPQIINLNDQNSIQILIQYIEVAQKAGTFLLQEAEILKRCKDVLFSNAQDNDISVIQAKQLFVQAVVKGQSHGAYTLDDASMLNKVCQFINNSLSNESQPLQQVQQESQVQQVQQVQQESHVQQESQVQEIQDDDDDMSSLSAPVPLRTPRHKIV